MDYLYFIYGLVLMLGGVVLAVLHGTPGVPALRWGRLAAAALLHGAYVWALLLDGFLPDSVPLPWVRLVLLTLSLLCFVDFGRSGLGAMQRTAPGIWPLLLFVVAPLTGGLLLDTATAEATVRHLVGIPASFLAGWVVVKVAAQMTVGSGALRTIGWLFFANSLAACLVIPQQGNATIPFAGVLYPADALSLVTVALQFLLATAQALCFWLYLYAVQTAARATGADPESAPVPRPLAWLPLALLPLFALGWVAAEWAKARDAREGLQTLLAHARITAAVFPAGDLLHLQGGIADTATPAYRAIRERLTAVRQNFPDCRSASLLGVRGDEVVFYATSQSETGISVCEPGEIMVEPAAARSVFRRATAAVEGPHRHANGDYELVVLVPIEDLPRRRVAAVLAVAVSAQTWGMTIAQHRLFIMTLVLLSVTVMVLGAVFAGFAVQRQDAASIRANEERYRQLLGEMFAGFVLAQDVAGPGGDTADFLVQEASPGFERLLGLQHGQAAGMRLSALAPAAWTAWRDRLLATTWQSRPTHLEFHSADEQRFLDGLAYRPSPRQLALLITDSTERRRAQQQMLQAQRMDSMGLLASGVAHDFNNLLMVILGNADLAERSLDSPESIGTCIQGIRKTALHAAELNRQMLIYAGQSLFLPGPVLLSPLVLGMEQLLRASLTGRTELSLELAPDLPAAEGDAGQLRQLVLNLLSNAAEATADRPNRIRLRTGTVQLAAAVAQGCLPDALPAGEYLFLEMEDTGSGMDADTRERMFDPFFSTKAPERGLGLAAVLGIVRGHHGGIRARSAKGEGTTVTVYLRPSQASASALALAPTATSFTAAPVTARVLLAEDESELRAYIKRMLETDGIRVYEAADGHAAMALFRQRLDSLDLLVLDLKMPGLDGEQVFAQARNLRAGIPALIVSGWPEAEVAPHFRGATGVAFLEKPFESAVLIGKVRQLAGLPPSTAKPRRA